MADSFGIAGGRPGVLRHEDRQHDALQPAALRLDEVELVGAVLARIMLPGAEVEGNVEMVVEIGQPLLEGGRRLELFRREALGMRAGKGQRRSCQQQEQLRTKGKSGHGMSRLEKGIIARGESAGGR
jgi:hypothetical protein